MNRKEIRNAIKVYVKDLKQNVYRDNDLNMFINEAIKRINSVPELSLIKILINDTDEVEYLPSEYHYLLVLYGTSRAFDQDERHYQAVQKMNEFEYKFEELVGKINEGSVIIKDKNEEPFYPEYNFKHEYVEDEYFHPTNK